MLYLLEMNCLIDAALESKRKRRVEAEMMLSFSYDRSALSEPLLTFSQEKPPVYSIFSKVVGGLSPRNEMSNRCRFGIQKET